MIRAATHWLFAGCLFFFTAGLTGCDNDREVLDVETPEGELEVEESTETGALDIETEENGL